MSVDLYLLTCDPHSEDANGCYRHHLHQRYNYYSNL